MANELKLNIEYVKYSLKKKTDLELSDELKVNRSLIHKLKHKPLGDEARLVAQLIQNGLDINELIINN